MSNVITSQNNTYLKDLLTYTNAYADMGYQVTTKLLTLISSPSTSPPSIDPTQFNAFFEAVANQITTVNSIVIDPTIKPLSLNILNLATRLKAYAANPTASILDGILADSLTYKTHIPTLINYPANDIDVYQAHSTLYCFLLALRTAMLIVQHQNTLAKAELTDLLSIEATALKVVGNIVQERIDYKETLIPAEGAGSGVGAGTEFTVQLDGQVPYQFARRYQHPPMDVSLLNTIRDRWEDDYTTLQNTLTTSASESLNNFFTSVQSLETHL